MLEYRKLLVLLVLGIVIACLIFLLSYTLVLKKSNPAKLSTYECGFIPFSDVRSKFEIHFYLVAILFIIFDLEILFLFPWVVVFFQIDVFGYFTMVVFLLILFVGFFYEWKKGALDW